MGTRGNYGFRVGDKEVIIYNHFDSYPDGLGADIINFFLSEVEKNGYEDTIGLLKQRVRSMEEINSRVKPTEEQKKFLAPYTDLSVSNQSTDDWYCLLRRTQGDIEATLDARYYEGGKSCGDNEYTYIINLNDETLEFYGYVADGHKFPLKELSLKDVSEMEKIENEDEDEED